MSDPLTEDGKGLLGLAVLIYAIVVIVTLYYSERRNSSKQPEKTGEASDSTTPL